MAKLPQRERASEIWRRLEQAHPDAHCALDHRTALELLVATILSAQCTDARVNQVTPALFRRYRSARAFAGADASELEDAIRSTGFYRNKAKSIRGACDRLVTEFGGKVPRTMEELLTLPGVARKTANVVLGVAYGIPSGIVVDTHCKRVAYRLGLTRQTDPVKVEQNLLRLVPEDLWIDISHQIIFHGRRICQARKPSCSACPLLELCPQRGLDSKQKGAGI
ncbi:MAG: endonuclease III [Planctomycetota bacterium]|nr:endonuclease III [Planctomycetota bacterium]